MEPLQAGARNRRRCAIASRSEPKRAAERIPSSVEIYSLAAARGQSPSKRAGLGLGFSKRRIEDWDFRDPKLYLTNPHAALFLLLNHAKVLAVETRRLDHVAYLVAIGLGELSEDGQYVVMASESHESGKLMPRRFRSVRRVAATDDRMVAFAKYAFRERFTRSGRRDHRIRQSLLRELEKTGRLKVSRLPADWPVRLR